jgi:hypothetical protein
MTQPHGAQPHADIEDVSRRALDANGPGEKTPMIQLIILLMSVALVLGPSVVAAFVDLDSVPE